VDPNARPVLFLGSPSLALPSLIVATVWQFTGYNMLLYYAGIQHLPREQLEAASIDGAGKRATIGHIVVPSLYPVLGTAVLLNVIGGLRIFELVYVLTRGGPNRASEVLGTYMYEQAFRISDMGYAAAIAVVIVLLSIGAAMARLRWGGVGT
jgi:raffinose/stachyose/melibiose transport system permease protein